MKTSLLAYRRLIRLCVRHTGMAAQPGSVALVGTPQVGLQAQSNEAAHLGEGGADGDGGAAAVLRLVGRQACR